MAGKVTDYVVASSQDIDSVQRQVRELIAKGYEPLGGLQIAAPVLQDDQVAPLFCQTLVIRQNEQGKI
jgi:hypothetical protein